MARPSEDDREAVDRAFAELVAGYHLTADRPEPAAPAPSPSPTPSPQSEPDTGWADRHQLFRFPEPEPEPAQWRELDRRQAERDRAADRYVPEPLPPLRRPGVPALLGWIGLGFAVLVVLVAAFGIHLPTWVGWLAVSSFLIGFGILISQLPRHRPPDAGDGAVL